MYKIRKFSRTYYVKHVAICFIIMNLLFAPAISLASTNIGGNALPSGVIESTGIGSFDYSTSGQLIINQTEEMATAHWESFNIGENSTVQFIQPSTSSFAGNNDSSLPNLIPGVFRKITGRDYMTSTGSATPIHGRQAATHVCISAEAAFCGFP